MRRIGILIVNIVLLASLYAYTAAFIIRGLGTASTEGRQQLASVNHQPPSRIKSSVMIRKAAAEEDGADDDSNLQEQPSSTSDAAAATSPSSPPSPTPSPSARIKSQGPEIGTPLEYFFGKEGELEEDLRSIGISRNRLLLNTGVATALALGANFLGITSGILGLLPSEKMDDLKLDVLYPVKGFKRFVDEEDGYTFRYPQAWLSDQAVLLAETQERTAIASTPIPRTATTSSNASRRRPGQGVRPDAAFGPPGGNYEENVSVVKSRVMEGFTMEGTLGPPRKAAEYLLSTAIAPPGSGKNATLIDARPDIREPDGLTYYEFEYIVRGSRFSLHSLSIITARPLYNTLFTLTVLAPEARWKEREKQLREVARSFHLTKR